MVVMEAKLGRAHRPGIHAMFVLAPVQKGTKVMTILKLC